MVVHCEWGTNESKKISHIIFFGRKKVLEEDWELLEEGVVATVESSTGQSKDVTGGTTPKPIRVNQPPSGMNDSIKIGTNTLLCSQLTFTSSYFVSYFTYLGQQGKDLIHKVFFTMASWQHSQSMIWIESRVIRLCSTLPSVYSRSLSLSPRRDPVFKSFPVPRTVIIIHVLESTSSFITITHQPTRHQRFGVTMSKTETVTTFLFKIELETPLFIINTLAYCSYGMKWRFCFKWNGMWQTVLELAVYGENTTFSSMREALDEHSPNSHHPTYSIGVIWPIVRHMLFKTW